MKFLKKVASIFVMAAALLGFTHKKAEPPQPQAGTEVVREQTTPAPVVDPTAGEDQVVNDPLLGERQQSGPPQANVPQARVPQQSPPQSRPQVAAPVEPLEQPIEPATLDGQAGAVLAQMVSEPPLANLGQQRAPQSFSPLDNPQATVPEEPVSEAPFNAYGALDDAEWLAAQAEATRLPDGQQVMQPVVELPAVEIPAVVEEPAIAAVTSADAQAQVKQDPRTGLIDVLASDKPQGQAPGQAKAPGPQGQATMPVAPITSVTEPPVTEVKQEQAPEDGLPSVPAVEIKQQKLPPVQEQQKTPPAQQQRRKASAG